MSDTIGLLPDEDTDTPVMTQAEVDEAMTVVTDILDAAASRRRPEVSDVIASLLARLELAEPAHSGKHDVSFDCDGRDYELVWDSAGSNSIDATLWDDTGEDPVQVATLRFTVQVITPPKAPYAAADDEPHIVRSVN